MVVKFQRGLNPQISTALTGIVVGRPSDRDPEQWFRLAVQMDQNQAADEAFHASHQTPFTSPSCSHCGAMEHLAQDCPHQIEAWCTNEDETSAEPLEAADETPIPIKRFHVPRKGRVAVPLSTKNRFSVLAVDEAIEPPPTSSAMSTLADPVPPPPASTPRPKTHRPRWERRMSRKLIIRSLEEGPNCIMLPIQLKTTDTMEEASTEAMVDTGATGDFIDQDFVDRAKLPTCKLSQPIPVYNVDGSLNEAGSIDKVVDVVMTYNGHSERILLAVTQLGRQSMILGFTWLKKHNPEIDFRTRIVKMSRCLPRCCTACRTEVREERKTQKADAQRIDTCRAGPLPAFVEDADDEDDLDKDAADPSEPLEDGDRIWATGLLPEPEHICATATISQQLAEAFKKNSEPMDYEKHIPPHLRDFHSVFSKESFDDLPESKPWDHAVELIPDATPKSCKSFATYPRADIQTPRSQVFHKIGCSLGF